ncbi:hypothetical protein CYMTET_46365 [Cymbomonas tetramitiformis]|uniref:SnoaL-like domain-containing protein n=1 Tax=Cymbomonas tetramitiformis TaxID=36881 RepID=A0AAE0BXI1_9CHLO|nr:hypothetical protein CYMTET_46365 [Cymbomonas tetramitiformis]
MAGECTDNVKTPEHAGCDFVAATGSYLGRMTAPWLGIPPPSSTTFVTIRYGEFYLIRDGKITLTFIIFDVPNLMLQCDVWNFPQVGNGSEIFIPGPKTNDGVCPEAPPSCPKESAKSLDLVEGMLFACKKYDQKNLESMGMEAYWHPQMLWYGPTGIGSTFGVDGFQQGHQGPFLKAFPDREGGNHKARFADGVYVASTGWPSMYATHKGSGWLGVDATEKSITMRVMDWWRRDGDSLRENWVFIDIPELLKQMGRDVLPYVSKG